MTYLIRGSFGYWSWLLERVSVFEGHCRMGIESVKSKITAPCQLFLRQFRSASTTDRLAIQHTEIPAPDYFMVAQRKSLHAQIG